MKLNKIAFFNPQGNFDPKDSHLTEHPDFGGQLVYVKELAKAIAKHNIKVDIITRKIIDPEWPEFSGDFDYYPETENVRIVRIPFGGKKFLNKELLWDHLGEYVKGIIKLYTQEKAFPDFVTTHYGDGGISGTMFLTKTGIKYSFTAHSLGAQKRDRLNMDKDEAEKKFRFSLRILAENIAMQYASFIVTSTFQEKIEQYMHKAYKKTTTKHEKKFEIIPPGVNTSIFHTTPLPEDKKIEEYLNTKITKLPAEKRNNPFVILSSRLDRKKYHVALIRAFAESEKLREKFNIVIVTRGIDDVFSLITNINVDSEEKHILEEITTLAKKNNFLDQILFLNIKTQKELAALYRISTRQNSIFALTALYEPFGLAIIEAMACGLPVVATRFGGPAEILDGGTYGALINPDDPHDISKGLFNVLDNYDTYKKLGLKRVSEKYTWEITAEEYLRAIEKHIHGESETPFIPDFFANQLR
ncbi:glycosyltransferase [Thermosipho ferrireducens]|uniref:sucrose-phosphate synthase n=1 Tax=Thermosipho ferrireducens TaxID=2571116 RepID=A0ABX7S692_9BACT|nr:glycosyltransferase [Thermosipho ferrireducens]QTA38096.1 glycosyltransferase [Thermosipho ferrireducens]